MSFKFVRNTTENTYNRYELKIDEDLCQQITKEFTNCGYFIYTPITPEYVRWVMEDGCRASTQENLSEAEQTFVNQIYDCLDEDIWFGDLWTIGSDIVLIEDSCEEI